MKGLQLVPLFHNCLQVIQSPDGMIPRRMTDKQLDFYKNIPYGAHMLGKAKCSAGITLEYTTDAPFFDICWMIDAGYPDSMKNRKTTLDLYVNGTLSFQHPVVCPHRQWQQTRFPLPAGNKRVCLVLPQTYEFILGELSIPEGTAITPIPRRERNLLFLCDSLGQGIGAACASTGYTMQTMLHLRNFEVLNQCVGGLRYDTSSIDTDIPTPELIVVQIGTNDWQRRSDSADFDRAMQAYLKHLTACFPSVPVILITPTKRCDGIADRPEMYQEAELFEAMRAHCSAYPHIACFNGFHLMPCTDAFFADGVHPNNAGHLWLAASITTLIKQRLHLYDC